MSEVVTITGANSFIGQELIQNFLENNFVVYAVSRKLIDWKSRVYGICADLSEYKNLSAQIPQSDIFINLAWEGTGHDGRNNKDLQSNNIKYTLEAIQSAKQMGCRIFIEAGSQAEYGITHTLTDENTVCNPFSEYGKAKLIVKEKAFELCEKLDMTYIHLRIFSLFGEKDHPWTLIMSIIDKMLKDDKVSLSECEQSWNFMYVKDAAKSIVNLCNSYINSPFPTQEVYNIASKDTRKLKEFVEEIRSLTNTSSELIYGDITPERIVSLLPDVSKLENRIGGIPYRPFGEVINNIIKANKK